MATATEPYGERIARVEGILEELREEMRDLRAEMRELRRSLDFRFWWLLGVQITTLLAILGALLAKA